MHPRLYHTATKLQNGRYLVAGGFDYSLIGGAEIYDVETNTSAVTGSLVQPRQAHTAALLASGRVLVTGGAIDAVIAEDTHTNHAEVYNPSTGTFSAVGAMATDRTGHTATTLPNGKVLITGGLTSGYIRSSELYVPATQNFEQVMFVGHSRGGASSIVAAASIGPNTLPEPLIVRGVFTIGSAEPSDLYRDRSDTAYLPRNYKTVFLAGMCDVETSAARTFDRLMKDTESVPTFKAQYVVWGANHNYYNSEWQESGSHFACLGHESLFAVTGSNGSPAQRQTALTPLLAFARANLGDDADPTRNRLFDPRYPGLPFPRVDRAYLDGLTPQVSLSLEDFSRATGTSPWGFANVHSNITIEHDHIFKEPYDDTMSLHEGGEFPRPGNEQPGTRLQWATIAWTQGSASRYFQTNWAASGEGRDLSSYETLDLRLDRTASPTNVHSPANFYVRLVGPGGVLSNKVAISDYVQLTAPVGWAVGYPHTAQAYLQTARIPLSAFTQGVLRSAVRGVRLEFSGSSAGQIYVTNIRASRPAAE